MLFILKFMEEGFFFLENNKIYFRYGLYGKDLFKINYSTLILRKKAKCELMSNVIWMFI